MRIGLRPLPVAFLAALLLAACASIPLDLSPPEATLVDVRYVGGTIYEQRFEFDLRFMNPNRRALDVEGLSFTVDLNGRQFARGVSDRVFVVPGLGEHVATVSAVTTLTQLIGQLANPGAVVGVSYAIDGRIVLGGFGSLPFSSKGQVGVRGGRDDAERGSF